MKINFITTSYSSFDIDYETSKMWMNAIKKIIKMKKNYLFIISVRREVEIENLYFKIFLKKLENFPNTIWNHKIFSNNLQTYNVTSISDLTISQNHSDIFFGVYK